jgi:hypothetical protein
MDMWNWLLDCYNEGSLTLEDLEDVMQNDRTAMVLWEDWSYDAQDFVQQVRDEVAPFLEYIKKDG